ncbi:MAG TPA: rhomboid family intramembrane serine protease [Streptosporangiaceae bacterium]
MDELIDSQAGQLAGTATVCYRHPRRECHVRCVRCDRYICPDCMREATVGFQCPDCVREGGKTVRTARTVFGARVTSGRPIATISLIAINVAVYAAQLLSPPLTDKLSAIGRELIGPHGIRYVWQPVAAGPFHYAGIAYGEWYRLLTSAFVHEPVSYLGGLGILHIAFNMWWLWTLGPVIEEQLGRVRFLALYILSALGSSVAVYLIAPDAGAIGASGAVFGLVGGYYVMSRRLHYDPVGSGRLMRTFLIWMVLSAWFASWQGHLGGLLTGLAAGSVIALARSGPRRDWYQAAGLALIAVALIALTAWQTVRIAGMT